MSQRVVTCPACEARLKITGATAVGTKIKCPKCEEPFRVSEDDAVTPSTPPRKAAARPASKPMTTSAKSSGRAREQVDKDPGVLIPLLGLGALLLVGIIVGGLFFVFSKDKPEEPVANAPVDKSAASKTESKDLKKAILGKWKNDFIGSTYELRSDGSMTNALQGAYSTDGTFRWLDGESIEYQLTAFGVKDPARRYKVKIAGNKLTLTEHDTNAVLNFTRTAGPAAVQAAGGGAAREAALKKGLLGKWQNDKTKAEYEFRADGTAIDAFAGGSSPLFQKYRWLGEILEIDMSRTPADKDVRTYNVQIVGDKLTLSERGFAETRVFTRMADGGNPVAKSDPAPAVGKRPPAPTVAGDAKLRESIVGTWRSVTLKNVVEYRKDGSMRYPGSGFEVGGQYRWIGNQVIEVEVDYDNGETAMGEWKVEIDGDQLKLTGVSGGFKNVLQRVGGAAMPATDDVKTLTGTVKKTNNDKNTFTVTVDGKDMEFFYRGDAKFYVDNKETHTVQPFAYDGFRAGKVIIVKAQEGKLVEVWVFEAIKPASPKAAAPPPAVADGNLIRNGSFEVSPDPIGFPWRPIGADGPENSFPGLVWKVTRGSIDIVVSPNWQAVHGQRSIDLCGWSAGTIAQEIKTEKGRKYRVSFWMAGNPGEGGGEKRLRVSAAGASKEFIFDSRGKTVTDMGWVEKTWDFVADADATTLEFASLTGGGEGAALDNVSVVALGDVAPPTKTAVGGAKPAEAIVGRWKNVKGNDTAEFGGDGQFKITEPGGPGLAGTYKWLDGSTIEIDAKSGNDQIKDKWTVTAVGDKLTISFDGESQVFTRVSGQAPAPVQPEPSLPPEPVAGGNLIRNGSFEVGPGLRPVGYLTAGPEAFNKFPGFEWTITRGDIDLIGNRFWTAAHGQQSLDLNGAAPATIKQAFKTEKGRRYRVTFWMAGNPMNGGGDRKLRVIAAGTTKEFSFDSRGKSMQNMGWVEKTWEFVANTPVTNLEFASLTEGGAGPAIDNVSVVALGGSPPLKNPPAKAPVDPAGGVSGGPLPKDAARYAGNGITFDHPMSWKAKAEATTITVQNAVGTQAMVQVHPAAADPNMVRGIMETTFGKVFDGKLVPGSAKAVKRKIAGAEREGKAMDFEVAKGVVIHFEFFAFPLAADGPVACVVFQYGDFDAPAARTGFDVIAASLAAKK